MGRMRAEEMETKETHPLAQTIERRILMETAKLRNQPERRSEIQAYCSGYLRALRNAGAISMDESDIWYAYMLDTIDHFMLKQPFDKLPKPELAQS